MTPFSVLPAPTSISMLVSSEPCEGPDDGAGRLAFSLEKMSSCLIVTTKKMMSSKTTSIIGVMSSAGFSCGLRAISGSSP